MIMEGGRGLEIKFINFCVCSASSDVCSDFVGHLMWLYVRFPVVLCNLGNISFHL